MKRCVGHIVKNNDGTSVYDTGIKPYSYNVLVEYFRILVDIEKQILQKRGKLTHKLTEY